MSAYAVIIQSTVIINWIPQLNLSLLIYNIINCTNLTIVNIFLKIILFLIFLKKLISAIWIMLKKRSPRQPNGKWTLPNTWLKKNSRKNWVWWGMLFVVWNGQEWAWSKQDKDNNHNSQQTHWRCWNLHSTERDHHQYSLLKLL